MDVWFRVHASLPATALLPAKVTFRQLQRMHRMQRKQKTRRADSCEMVIRTRVFCGLCLG